MNTYTRVNTGLEALLCRRESEILAGVHGLAGFEEVATFDELGAFLEGSGEFAGVRDHVRELRRKHAIATRRVLNALPVAVSAFNAVAGLSGLKKDIKKALKSDNVAKITKALAAEQKKLDKAPTSKKAPARAAYVQQLQAQLAKVNAAASASAPVAPAVTQAALNAAGITPTVAASMTPEQVGAAVLAASSGASFSSPAAQQFAEDTVTQAAATGDTGLIFGMPPMIAAGVGVAAVGALYLALRRKR